MTAPAVIVRAYTDEDVAACRGLWAELTEHHRRLYEDPSIGGPDPGSYFDEYLQSPELAAAWVAERSGEVVGLTGLLLHDDSGEVEPVVVAESHRGEGIGSALIGTVVDEARRRNLSYLSIRPVARNVDAITAFYRTGFRTLGGHIDLTLDLGPRAHAWHHGVTLHGLPFEY